VDELLPSQVHSESNASHSSRSLHLIHTISRTKINSNSIKNYRTLHQHPCIFSLSHALIRIALFLHFTLKVALVGFSSTVFTHTKRHARRSIFIPCSSASAYTCWSWTGAHKYIFSEGEMLETSTYVVHSDIGTVWSTGTPCHPKLTARQKL
jgi:hypothetical protein